MFNLEIWVTKFCIQESQAFKRPRHVVVYLLLTFQRVAHVGTFGSVASALQIVAQVPATVATILYAHVAQHGVEVECCHVERLGHLRGSQSVLGLLVQYSQSLANYIVGHRQNLLRTWQRQLLSVAKSLALQLLPSQHQLGSHIVLKLGVAM